jgi:hypothetical protein
MKTTLLSRRRYEITISSSRLSLSQLFSLPFSSIQQKKEQAALKAMADKAKAGGPLVGGGIKKSGKK